MNASPWIIGALDPNQEEGHEGEEEGDDQAKSVDCLVSNHHCTVHLYVKDHMTVLRCSHRCPDIRFEHLNRFSFQSVKPRQVMSIHQSPMRGAERYLGKDNICRGLYEQGCLIFLV